MSATIDTSEVISETRREEMEVEIVVKVKGKFSSSLEAKEKVDRALSNGSLGCGGTIKYETHRRGIAN